MPAATLCNIQSAKTQCHTTLCTKNGWQQTGRYALVALAVIAAIGIAVAITMKCGSFDACFGGEWLSSIPNFSSYLLTGSAIVFGSIVLGRTVKCFH